MSTRPSTSPLTIGLSVGFRRTVSESDIYLFAGITGDHSPNHTDEVFMRGTRYGQRIAHGALMVGFMSRASTMIAELAPNDHPLFPVSLGYDRIRLLEPVFIGDTITVTYNVAAYDAAAQRSTGAVSVTNEAAKRLPSRPHYEVAGENVGWVSALPREGHLCAASPRAPQWLRGQTQRV